MNKKSKSNLKKMSRQDRAEVERVVEKMKEVLGPNIEVAVHRPNRSLRRKDRKGRQI